MAKQNSDDILASVSRRNFLRTGTCGLMGIGPLVNTICQLKLMQSAAASTVSSDYKAIVCLFLRGGCDMNNVLIPIGSNPQVSNYQSDRSVIQISEQDIANAGSALNLPSASDQQYGLHPAMPKTAAAFNSGRAAMVSNVGTLAEPTTRSNYDTAIHPRQLFSHSDQTTQWMSSISDKSFTSGWGGRVADLINDTANPESAISMLITASGNNDFMVSPGGSIPQYSVSSTGAISLSTFGTNYSNALEENGDYRTNTTGQRLKAMEQIMAYSHAHILEDGYRASVKRARDSESRVAEALTLRDNLSYTDPGSGSSVGLDFQSIFDAHGSGNTTLASEMIAILNMIAGREALGNQRQIFFVDLDGFDNHAALLSTQAPILENLDNCLAAYNECLDMIALADANFSTDQVTLYTASDFNRTWTANSDDTSDAGTDHAWGTHTFVMGGAVRGGQLWGRGYPELAVGGADDVPSGSRGRWIPTTSVDEYSATLANWFGINYGSSEMATIFPNLNRFVASSSSAPASELDFLTL